MDDPEERRTVPVATATDRIEAELIVGFLRSCGIATTLSSDADGASVLVDAADEAAARRYLAEVDDGRG